MQLQKLYQPIVTRNSDLSSYSSSSHDSAIMVWVSIVYNTFFYSSKDALNSFVVLGFDFIT